MLFAQALLLTFWASWPSPLGPLAPSPPQGHFWAMMSTQEKKNNYFASSDPHQWDLAVGYWRQGGWRESGVYWGCGCQIQEAQTARIHMNQKNLKIIIFPKISKSHNTSNLSINGPYFLRKHFYLSKICSCFPFCQKIMNLPNLFPSLAHSTTQTKMKWKRH